MFSLDYLTGFPKKNYNIVHYDYKVILKLKGRKYSIIKHLDLEVYPSI